MKVVKIKTLAPNGLQMQEITVEVATRPGLASLTIVGLAGRSLVESKERIRLALRSIGVTLPSTSVVVNLAPAEVAKDGTHYDLPIALALLISTGYLQSLPKDLLVFGELGLNGQIRRVRQAISFAIYAKQHYYKCLFPKVVASEVSLVRGVKCHFARSLRQLMTELQTPLRFATSHKVVKIEALSASGGEDVIFDNILGQSLAKRVALIAVGGNHNLLLAGPPGVGKSLLAKAINGLMPEILPNDQLEATSVYSSKGLLSKDQPVINRAPFRAPHHTSSTVSLVGGGNPVMAGEVSLAHKGVLFLDELPLFSKSVLEALREPLQNKQITISRARQSVTFPADFLLVAAINPCPCGYLGSQTSCRCTVGQISSYQAKLSGPILDRFNLFTRLSLINKLDHSINSRIEHIKAQKTAQNARACQLSRQGKLNQLLTQDEVNLIIERDHLRPILEETMNKLSLSLRAVYASVRVAQTIADIENSSNIKPVHLAEAISYLPPRQIS